MFLLRCGKDMRGGPLIITSVSIPLCVSLISQLHSEMIKITKQIEDQLNFCLGSSYGVGEIQYRDPL